MGKDIHEWETMTVEEYKAWEKGNRFYGTRWARRASIKTMRRRGLRWRTIIKCILGFHGRAWQHRCARCGAGL